MIGSCRIGSGIPLLCLILSACGSGLPDQSQAREKASTANPELTVGDHAFTSTDCNKLLDPGLKAACLSCASNPNAFQGCTTAGNVFDPLSCKCLATAPGDSKKCGGVFCPAGGECCTTGTAPFAVQFCELPGSPLPPLLQQRSTCNPVCPSDRPSACGDSCVNLQTDNANCGTCGNGCAGTGVSCGGGGTPGVCGCTPSGASVACGAHNCGTAPNGCGGTVDCGTCTGTGVSCGGGGTPGVCGCTPVTAAVACAGKCGAVADGCGGTIDCGNTCGAGQVCSAGTCVDNSPGHRAFCQCGDGTTTPDLCAPVCSPDMQPADWQRIYDLCAPYCGGNAFPNISSATCFFATETCGP